VILLGFDAYLITGSGLSLSVPSLDVLSYPQTTAHHGAHGALFNRTKFYGNLDSLGICAVVRRGRKNSIEIVNELSPDHGALLKKRQVII
jgi:hypothetical protein